MVADRLCICKVWALCYEFAMPDGRPPQAAPNCLKCRHFVVTWNRRFPRACRAFGIQTPRMPSVVVFEQTGYHCPAFEPAPGHTRPAPGHTGPDQSTTGSR